jgi:hypothetical protein
VIEDDLRAIRQELRELRTLLTSRAETASDGYLKMAAAARALSVSPRTISRALVAGCPHVGSGRMRRVRLADVAAWLSRGEGAGDLERRADELLRRGRDAR